MKTVELARYSLGRELVTTAAASRAIGIFSFIALTALGAYVRLPLPFTPVPLTLQTFFVLLSGAVLGKKWGALSQAGYILLGLLGWPIFSGAGAGAGVLLGPTGGYLLGFVASSFMVGRMSQRQTQYSLGRLLGIMSIATFFGIYLFGTLGLKLFLQCSFGQALKLGLLPFLAGDMLKIIIASFIFGKIGRRCQEIFGADN